MDYLQGSDDGYDAYDDEAPAASGSRRRRMQRNFGILAVIVGLLGTTFAANISLGGARKEFGQGIFQIKACDQWVGVGLVAGANTQNEYVANLELYGFDPRLCLGRVFQVKLYTTKGGSALPLYLDDSSTAGSADTATSLSIVDTTTAYSSSYPLVTGMTTAFQSWSRDAVSINNKWGTNVGRMSTRLYVTYLKDTAVYKFVFFYPLAKVADVNAVTIESACYTLPTTPCR